MKIDVVEIEETVIAIATEVFQLPVLHPRLNIILDDALEFLARAKSRSYQLVICDVSAPAQNRPAVPPPAFLTSSYFASVARTLTPDGVYFMHIWKRDEVSFIKYLANVKKFPFKHVIQCQVRVYFSWVFLFLKSEHELGSPLFQEMRERVLASEGGHLCLEGKIGDPSHPLEVEHEPVQ
jgi:spermidine synthase